MDRAQEKPLYVLGISAYYHDSAAALLRNGVIVAAAHEERFTRKSTTRVFRRMPRATCWRRPGPAWRT